MMGTQFEYFKDICTSESIRSILRESSEKMTTLEQVFGGNLKDIFKTKMTSELRSKTIERTAAEELSRKVEGKVLNPDTDNDPDLRFPNGYPLEVKVTANETFLGGEFSKRPSPTLLIAGSDSFFVALADLEKEDWKSGGENFYGTSLSKPKIYELVQQGRAVVLCGELYEMMKKDGSPRKRRAFKMVKEVVTK
jgi:hypothetical protein